MKTVIIVELIDNKQLNVSGPLEDPADRILMVEMLEKAIDVCRHYKGSGLLIANNALITDMAQNKINHQSRVIL